MMATGLSEISESTSHCRRDNMVGGPSNLMFVHRFVIRFLGRLDLTVYFMRSGFGSYFCPLDLG